jgi:ornithine cyclodeaminase/alanine dehydrogenase-like protein (mu-crystallin family)
MGQQKVCDTMCVKRLYLPEIYRKTPPNAAHKSNQCEYVQCTVQIATMKNPNIIMASFNTEDTHITPIGSNKPCKESLQNDKYQRATRSCRITLGLEHIEKEAQQVYAAATKWNKQFQDESHNRFNTEAHELWNK